ncbi:MAG: hypothetical protein CVT49_06915 [candidate division Zixibacteria bacterium HGW-Zixibacteria-1]|nr:MAG: hypothetical protein CVT49_06915 [candidate division Zixibacteria bacterium HGW-Zixibacteria-1]
MAVSIQHNDKYRIAVWLFVAVVSIIGLYLWVDDLDADPPMYFDGQSQSLSTDPHHYSYFARNKILFDKWELFDTGQWRVFEVTLISAFSYILFSFFGISRTIANIPGLFSILAAIFIFLAALRKYLKPWALAVILILLLFNKVLFVYGRLPYTENGMILILALLYYVFVHYRDQSWGILSMGVLIALAAFAGKIFGIIIAVPVIICLWIENKPDRIKNIAGLSLSSLAVAILWILIFYGGNLGHFYDYYRSQTVGLYGFPDAFKSPVTFFEKLINFGNDSRFFFHAPVVGLAGFVALASSIVFLTKNKMKENMPLLFLIIWFTAGLLFFMPENYRPLRYIYMLYLPLAGMFGLLLSSSFQNEYGTNNKKNYFRYVLMFFLIWILLEQLAFNIFYIGLYGTMSDPMVIYSLPPAVLITYLVFRFDLLRIVRSRLFIGIIAVVSVLAVFINFGLPYRDWQQQKSFNIKEAGEDLAQILGENAVICGPMAPSLLLENNLKGSIYAVGVSDQDPRFFRKNPITHFAIDADASGMILDKYEELTSAITTALYWIRDGKIVIVNISHLTGNKEAARYQPTDYEIARIFMQDKVYDSALYYMERFTAKYPGNKSALKSLGDLYPLNGRPDKAMALLQRADSLYPRDFSVKFALAMYYQRRFVASGDDRFRHLARQTYEQVVAMNPYQADEVTEITRWIASLKQ